MVEETLVWIVWVAAAAALLSSGIAVVLFSNPFFSALALIANLASLAVLYLLLAAEFVVVVALKAGERLSRPEAIREAFGSPREIGRLFLSDHLLAFEVTAVVLLVAAIGGVVLGMTVPKGERAE